MALYTTVSGCTPDSFISSKVSRASCQRLLFSKAPISPVYVMASGLRLALRHRAEERTR